MKLFERIGNILSKPSQYFETIKAEQGVKQAFVFYVILTAFSNLLGFIIGSLTFVYFKKSLLIEALRNTELLFGATRPLIDAGLLDAGLLSILLSLAPIVLGLYILGLGLSFVVAGLLHIWILIFGGRKGYAKTYQIFVYIMTPSLLFGWIPFGLIPFLEYIIGMILWIWLLVLLIKATHKLQDISKLKSILMYVIPAAILVLFALISLALFASFFFLAPLLAFA